MYALEKGLRLKWLAVLFSLFTVLASFGIGNMVQANSISTLAASTFGVNVHVSGAIMTVLTAVVILGGLRSIARVCEWLVPFMAIVYIGGCLIILAANRHVLLPAIELIVTSAFQPTAPAGGFAGATVIMAARYGVARGLFSNESGLGSAPIVAAAAQSRNPVRQALVSATGTFWDTVVIYILSGLVIVSSILAQPSLGALRGSEITAGAFGEALPTFGPIVLTLGLLTFVFSTILGWSYYGERAAEYLWGKVAILPYRIVWVVAVYVGSVVSLNFVWDFSDLANGLMALPNLIALVLLSNVVAAETRRYLTSGNLDSAGD
jgi:AGCS family alanine or glycine:cation symporter